MAMESGLVSIISKKTIKPFSPTPSEILLHKLCLPGQAFTLNYIPLVLFYPKHQVDTIPNGPKNLSEFLEISFSKTLASYYPWAGRLKNNATVECNDSGADYFEVQVSSPMDEVLHHSDSSIKDIATFPQGVPWARDCLVHPSWALATAQLSHFECGGIAISVCLSHKVGDGCSVYWFLRDWAALTRDPNHILLSPYFVQDSIIPSPSDYGPLVSPVSKIKQECVEKTFDFSASKLSALQALVESEAIQHPTRNEVVNALVYKCAANAASSANPHQLVQYMNIRETTSPPLPPTSIGNSLTVFSTPIHKGDLELDKK
ncbi:acyltransferase Pun1-like [Lycium ferocissimum]|uniref:acyltransferase Pun1-like n=1 Tax=Lycium ferocissimum TaxID=112874 RepID=UPI002814EEA7|nr:acyltransferase Pun1-like [Lycium ferocissimum]